MSLPLDICAACETQQGVLKFGWVLQVLPSKLAMIGGIDAWVQVHHPSLAPTFHCSFGPDAPVRTEQTAPRC